MKIAFLASSSPYPPLAAPREAVASSNCLRGQLGAGGTSLFLGPHWCMHLWPGTSWSWDCSERKCSWLF